MSEQEQTGAGEEKEVDITQVSDSDLENMLFGGKADEAVSEETPVEKETEVAEQEETETETSEAASADSDAENGETQEPPSEIDILRAKLDAAEESAKHFEQVAGRHAGKIGFLEKKIRELAEAKTARSGDTDDLGESLETAEQARPAASQQGASQDSAVSIRMAINQAVSDVSQQHPELFVNGENGQRVLDPGFLKTVADMNPDAQSLLLARTADESYERTTNILTDAAAKFLTDRKRAVVAEMERRKADSAATLKKAKRAASISSSSGASAGEQPQRRPQSPQEMTDKQLDDAIAEMSAD